MSSSSTCTAFSNDGVEVISRKIEAMSTMEADLKKRSERDITKYYEIEKCSNFIKTKDFRKDAYDVEVESFTSGGETFQTLFSKPGSSELTTPSSKRAKVNTSTSTSGMLSKLKDDHDLKCNTVKDKTTLNHKTAGILMGAWPCGKIVMLGELYGSESLSRVYGQVHTLLQENTRELNGLRFLCYDDGCHLKKFACNSKRKDSTTTSKWISSLDIVVDELHFRGHVDKWCHEHCNPNDFDELNKIALQFPDFLLPNSSAVTSLLQKEFPEKHFFILGDTSYGSCCVDEVAAQHAVTDCIIHFGPACLTPTKRLPALYIFGIEDVDTEHCAEIFKSLFPQKEDSILVLYDVVYAHYIDEFKSLVGRDYPNCVVSSLLVPDLIQHKSHDLSDKTHLQSSTIEQMTRELCCSSCGKAGAGSCSSKAKESNDNSKQETVVDGEEKRTDISESSGESERHTGRDRQPEDTLDKSDVNERASKDDVVGSCQSSEKVEAQETSKNESDDGVTGMTEGTSDKMGTVITTDVPTQGNTSTDPVVEETKLLSNSTTSEHDGAGNDMDAVTSEPRLHKYERFGRSFQLSSPIEQYKVFYIGTEGPTLTNLILNYNKCQFYSYNPISREGRRETLNVNKALGRRYFLVQKAKEAKTVGILVGTLGAGDYLNVIERLKQVLKRAGKTVYRYYTIAVGKLNVPKMANFLEIDVYVLVACPENSLIDSHEFFKPVITPFELELACMRSREWSGDFTTAFQDLLPGGMFHSEMSLSSDKDSEEPEYSLITGGLVLNQQTSQDQGDATSSAVVQRSKMEVALGSSAGAQFLQNRSWKGLEQRLGETEVAEVKEGRTGLPISYSHEHESIEIQHNTQ